MANAVKTIYEYKCTKCGLLVNSNIRLTGRPKGKISTLPLCTRRIGKPRPRICGGVLKFVGERPVAKAKAPIRKPTSKLD